MRQGFIRFWLVLFGSVLASDALHAEEMRVSAKVLSVTPETVSPRPICDVPPPERSAGLAAALRWDLRGRCRESDEPPKVTGYAVVYEWDGQRFSTVLPSPPKGDRLALRLHID